MAPVTVVAQTDVAGGRVPHFLVMYDGERQRKRPIGPRNDTAVAVGLLHVVVVAFKENRCGSIEAREIVDGRQIGGGQ